MMASSFIMDVSAPPPGLPAPRCHPGRSEGSAFSPHAAPRHNGEIRILLNLSGLKVISLFAVLRDIQSFKLMLFWHAQAGQPAHNLDQPTLSYCRDTPAHTA